MAEDSDRTEQPTARRRQEARTRGQIARSQDLTAAVLLLVGLLTLKLFGGDMLDRLGQLMAYLLGGAGEGFVRSAQMVPLGYSAAREMFAIVGPVLAVFAVAALVVALLQTGWLFTTEPLRINFERLNPAGGLKKMFSLHSAVMLLINVGKMVVVAAVAYHAVMNDIDRIVFAVDLSFPEMVALALQVFFNLSIRVAAALLFLGILDWFYQRAKHERSLRMTKQEVKEELRRMEGDPMMKRRRREVQMQLAIQRLRHDVPKADVVVTNPTHVAVAIQYDAQTMAAPKVIAKGEGYVAERIRQIAIQAGIPVVERKPLARALFKMVKVGEHIPPQLYRAVAELLAYVYELSGRHRAAAPA